MGMQATKMPILKYNPVTGEVTSAGRVIPVVSTNDYYRIVQYNNGYMLFNTKVLKTAGVVIPVNLVKDINNLGVAIKSTYIIFYYKETANQTDYTYWAEIGKDTMLVYKIEPNDDNYNVTETQYFLDLYGTKLMYTLSEPCISENIVNNILTNATKTVFKEGVLIDTSLLNQKIVDEYDDFDDVASEDEDDFVVSTKSEDVTIGDDFDDEDDDISEDDIETGTTDFDDEDDFFDDEEVESLEDMLSAGKLSLKEYSLQCVKLYAAMHGELPKNTLIPQRFWDLFCSIANKCPWALDFFAYLWRGLMCGGEQFSSYSDYIVLSENSKTALLTVAFVLVANECHAYTFADFALNNAHDSKLSTLYTQLTNERPRPMEYVAAARDKQFNCMPAALIYFEKGVNIPFSGNNNMDAADDYLKLGYERCRDITHGTYSYYDVTAWLSVDHLLARVRNPKFKYPFPYCSGRSAGIFISPLLLATIAHDIMEDTTEHTFMSDIYNIIAAPNPSKPTNDYDNNENFSYSEAVVTLRYNEMSWGAAWYSRLPYNMARRLANIVYCNHDNDVVYGYWDDLPNVKSLPRTMAKHNGINYNVSKQVEAYYAERWSVMCPEYDLYLRHTFEHHAFREIVLTCFATGCYFLLDAFPHDDNYVAMSDEDAISIRRFVDIAAYKTYDYIMLNIFASSCSRGNPSTLINKLASADDAKVIKYVDTIKKLSKLMKLLVKKCSNLPEAFSVYSVLVVFMSKSHYDNDNINVLSCILNAVESAKDNSSLYENLYFAFADIATDVHTYSLTNLGKSITPEGVEKIRNTLRGVFTKYMSFADIDAAALAWTQTAGVIKDAQVISDQSFYAYLPALKLYYVQSALQQGYWSVTHLYFFVFSESSYAGQPERDFISLNGLEYSTLQLSKTILIDSDPFCCKHLCSTVPKDAFVYKFINEQSTKVTKFEIVKNFVFVHDFIGTEVGLNGVSWDELVEKLKKLYNVTSLSKTNPLLKDKEFIYMFGDIVDMYTQCLQLLDSAVLNCIPESMLSEYTSILTNFATQLLERRGDSVLHCTPTRNITNKCDDFADLDFATLDFIIALPTFSCHPDFVQLARENSIGGISTYSYEKLQGVIRGFSRENQPHLKKQPTSDTVFCSINELLHWLGTHVNSSMSLLVNCKQKLEGYTTVEQVIDTYLNTLNNQSNYFIIYLLYILKHCFDNYVIGESVYNELRANSQFLIDGMVE